jgi:hypothetical protein
MNIESDAIKVGDVAVARCTFTGSDRLFLYPECYSTAAGGTTSLRAIL